MRNIQRTRLCRIASIAGACRTRSTSWNTVPKPSSGGHDRRASGARQPDHVRLLEIVAPEEEALVEAHGKGVGSAITQVQPSRVPALAVSAPCRERDLGLARVEGEAPLSRRAPSATLAPINGNISSSSYATWVYPNSMAVDLTGTHLVVANSNSNNASMYAIALVTGALAIKLTFDTGLDPTYVAFQRLP